jgi:hypothetical protein
MPTSPSSIGFGHNPWGDSQWGFGDWAEEMLWKLIPAFYRDADAQGPSGSITPQPLRGFIDAIKPEFQELRIKWYNFPTLWDANTVPLASLPALAYNVGITVDPTKAEGLQRSSTLNAAQLWANKGTDKGYQITAAFEGLLVTVTRLYAVTAGRARQVLGTIGATAASFDLSTTPIELHPVGPGLLHLQMQTYLGLMMDVRDDEKGNLVGFGVQTNGPLTKLAITRALTFTISGTVGLIKAGDTITQGPASGLVLNVGLGKLKVNVTAGTFAPGPITDITSSATTNATLISTDVMAVGDTITGLTSGNTAIVRDSQPTYLIEDVNTTGAGFFPNETLVGAPSGNYAVAGISNPLIPGPLRDGLTASGVIGVFIAGEFITGSTSGAVGVLRSISGASLFADTITLPGFTTGETITGGTSGATATIAAQSFGTINYLSGEMSGMTTALAPGAQAVSVVDLVTTPPNQFVPQVDAVPGDVLPVDDVQPTHFSRWPFTLVPVQIVNGILTDGFKRSHSLRLFFYKPDDTEIENFIDVANRIITSLENFRPIHVVFDSITFDGARASSQVWRTGPIRAENYASAVWTGPIVSNQIASSQVWAEPLLHTSATF